MTLRQATVALVGVGGIGSPCPAISRRGGHRPDRRDRRRCRRPVQSPAPDDLRHRRSRLCQGGGRRGARARAINPHVDVLPRRLRLDTTNVAATIAGADVVLDGCDNFATRLLVADACHAARIPLVSAAVDQFEGQACHLSRLGGGAPLLSLLRRRFTGTAGSLLRRCRHPGTSDRRDRQPRRAGGDSRHRALRRRSGGQHPARRPAQPALPLVRLPKDPGCTTCGGVQTPA